MNVLLVDDNADILKMMARMLEHRGHQVATCMTPFGVSALILRDRPDVVVLDVMMPGLGGPALANIIARLELDARPVLVLWSAMEASELAEASREAGGLPTLSKALRPSAMIAEIERLARR